MTFPALNQSADADLELVLSAKAYVGNFAAPDAFAVMMIFEQSGVAPSVSTKNGGRPHTGISYQLDRIDCVCVGRNGDNEKPMSSVRW
jgi:hypothetical protein